MAPRRLSSYELQHSHLIQIRDRYVKAVEDLGLTADFVSYQQIENGELQLGKYRALLLPGSVALSTVECTRISEFVRAVGVEIGDIDVGVMDEHCRRLPAGERQFFYRAVDRRGPAVVSQVFRTAGINPPVQVSGAAEIKTWRFTSAGRDMIALMQNPAKVAPNPRAVRVHVVLPQPARVRDGSKDFGVVRELDLDLGPWMPELLEVRPAR